MTQSTLLLASAIWFVSGSGLAQDPARIESTAPGQILVQEEIEAALLKLADQNALPAGPDAKSLIVSAPAKLRYDLGAVIDLSPGAQGFLVLGVTPLGSAEHAGLRPGDRILQLNDLALTTDAVDTATLHQAIAERDGTFELQVVRDGQTLTLTGQAGTVQTPGYSLTIDAMPGGCGRVSTFTSMPRSKQLFPIQLRRIDGIEQANGPPNYRLDVGRHVLMLAESIPSVELNSSENLQRNQLRQRRMAKFKYFEIDVEPDTTYFLASKLAPYPRDVVNNAHWEPVIWKHVKQPCR